MDLPMEIMVSTSHDPCLNCAAEEYLLNHRLERGQQLAFLYSNNLSVNVGKNQNAALECRLDRLERAGGILIRRTSGGGTVYHDPGNLNFAFMVPRENFNPDKYYAMILGTLERMGFVAHLGNWHDIRIGAHKVSGNAYRYRRDRGLHHGTLLISADLDSMRELLTPENGNDLSRHVRSVPAEVINLNDIRSTDIDEALGALIKTVTDSNLICNIHDFDPASITDPEFESLLEKYRSPVWNLEGARAYARLQTGKPSMT